MHFLHPVAQRIKDEAQRLLLDHVHRVAAAGVVHIPGAVFLEAVVDGVVDAAKTQRGAPLVALGRVVEDDVEDHLEARAVQRPDHAPKLVHLAAAVSRRVAVVRREVADRLVAPVVAQPALHELSVVNELVHRQELDRGDTEALQVSDGSGMREARVGAA